MATTPKFSAADTQRRGPCATCGFNSILGEDGRVTYHFQIRIRRGLDGSPEEYVTRTACDGYGHAPEQVA